MRDGYICEVVTHVLVEDAVNAQDAEKAVRDDLDGYSTYPVVIYHLDKPEPIIRCREASDDA